MSKEKGQIVMEGMGGFLCPPGHPMHKQSVQIDLRRRPENRGSMALDYAVESPTLDDATRAVARTILATWERNKLALASSEVQDWILQVLGYFAGCYNLSGEESGWDAGKLTINKDANPVLNADKHAGVHLIRKYYPDFQPTPEHFFQAYWGTKP